MKVTTKHFGEVEVDENKIVTFENGIFGFEDQTQFIFFFEDEEAPNGLCWMQSLDDTQLALPVINPIYWYPEYSPEVADEEVSKIGALKEEDLQIFSVVVITDAIETMTTNLKAPIIINHETKKGTQVVCSNDDYNIKHNLYEQMKLMKAGE